MANITKVLSVSDISGGVTEDIGFGQEKLMPIFEYCLLCGLIGILLFVINLIIGIKLKNKKMSIATTLILIIYIIDIFIRNISITSNSGGWVPFNYYNSFSVGAIITYGIVIITFIAQIIVFLKLIKEIKNRKKTKQGDKE